MHRFALTSVWPIGLAMVLILWMGIFAPLLAQAERLCESVAATHEYDGAHGADVPSALDFHVVYDDCHAAKHGHCHTPLAHDQVDAPRGLMQPLNPSQQLPFHALDPRFHSFIPSLLDRPPKV